MFTTASAQQVPASCRIWEILSDELALFSAGDMASRIFYEVERG